MNNANTIHVWHLLTLVLAFVAGGALVTHVPNLLAALSGDKPIELASSASANTGRAIAGINADGANTATRLVAQAPAPIHASGVDQLPLFWQNAIDDLRQEALAAREEIDELRNMVEELSYAVDTQEILAAQNLTEGSIADSSGTENVASGIDEFGNFRRGGNRSGNRDALIRAGVSPELANTIQQQQDQLTLARLELLDQAAREGWTESERLDEELEALDEASPSLRDELGDDAYDRYLFNAGRSNRVSIASVIAGSTADLAGLQVGDVITSYASERLFTMRELRDATRQGVRNEPILLEVVRNQQSITLEAVRGPLGVTMTPSRVEP